MIWEFVHVLYRILLWILVVLLVLMMFGKIRMEQPVFEHDDERVELKPSWFVFLFDGLVSILLLLGIASYLHRRTGLLANLFPFCFGIWALGSISDLPATIVICSEGLEQVYWLRRNKRISWDKIVEIESSPKSRLVIIKSSDGSKITHSAFLSGRARLLLEIKKYCGDQLPQDFPREKYEK